jgi:hypothetical protein
VPPFAICCNERCPVYVDLYEEREGPSSFPPPQNCPSCYARLVWYCHACFRPLIQLPNQLDPRCSHCNKRLPITSNEKIIFSDGAKNMPYALCSNSKCDFSVELHDRVNGNSRATPKVCPRCKGSMISICPECGFLLMGTQGATACAVCRADIRSVFKRWRARAQSA